MKIDNLEKFFEEVYNESKCKALFEDIYINHLIECKTIPLLNVFKANYQKLEFPASRVEAIKKFVSFFEDTGKCFEDKDSRPISYISFMKEMIKIVRAKPQDYFSLDTLKKCLYYLFLGLSMNSYTEGIKKDDLRHMMVGNKSHEYIKNYHLFYKALDQYLKDFFAEETKLTDLHLEDLTEEELAKMKSIFEIEEKKINLSQASRTRP